MTQRFHAVEYRRRDEIAIVTMNNPPVNGLSHGVRMGLVAAFEHAIADAQVGAIVLAGTGKAFSAGGDIRELGSPAASAAPALSLHVHPVIEHCPKPTVAALHGIAMGGGLETALVCHGRVAAADTRIALPEIKLGLIPLSGTQRLPRVLGLQAAMDFILEAKTMLARDFAAHTLFDTVLDAEPQVIVEHAIDLARAMRGKPLPLLRDRSIGCDDAVDVLNRARDRAAAISHAAVAAVDAIAGAVEAVDFEAGMRRAREIFDALSTSDEVRRQSERFLAERGNPTPRPA